MVFDVSVDGVSNGSHFIEVIPGLRVKLLTVSAGAAVRSETG